MLLIGVSLVIVITTFTLAGAYITITIAEDVPTSLNVNNSPPSISAGPVESTASTGTNPTNEGSNVTFQATANEPNNENYYLAICKTDEVTGGSGGAAPTCDGGAWCVSAATSSDSQATCSHTTVDGDDEISAWYAFVCDNNSSSSACTTTGAQGTGDSGSPFNVNHDPNFSAIADDGGSGSDSGADPGGTMTFTATASDSDTDTSSDTVVLVVCGDTAGATTSGCIGTEICVSTTTASNPSCTEPIPSVALDTSVNYYAYVFDSHDLGSGSNYISGVYAINNVAPTVSAVTINGGSNITLTEGTTTNVIVTGTITDNNSCQDLVTVESSVYRSSVTYSGCDTNAEDDNNDCYAQVTCTVAGTDTCDSATDAVVDYTCTVPVQYHADPTVTSTEYPTETWLSTINAVDSSLSDNTEVAAGVEMNTLNAIDVTSGPIDYGSLNVGESNSTLTEDIRVTATGNIGSDLELSGTNMTDGGSENINVNKQKYAFCPDQDYSADGTVLSSNATEEEIDLPKTTISASPYHRDIFWGLEIPEGTIAGSYSGTNTITSVLDESTTWEYEDPCFTEGLVGYWPMNESSADSCSGGEDSCDFSGNDFHLDWSNNTTYTTGNFGNATTYDGTNDSASCADGVCGGIGNLDFNYNDSFTYSAWFNTSNTTAQTLIIGKKGRNLVGLPGYMMSIFAGGEVACWLADGSNQIVPWGTSQNNDGEWHHAACVYDGEAKTYKLYVDGQYEWDSGSSDTDVTAGGISGNFNSTWGFHTGLMIANSAFDFNGEIDDVRVFNRALSAHELDLLHQHVPD